jgi:Asp-tRNA(Asn)/Glu-tRNA(Gln) amidotransferase B subunit
LEQDPSLLASYRKGKTNVVKAISGAVMAASRGKANPVLLAKLLAERLTKL